MRQRVGALTDGTIAEAWAALDEEVSLFTIDGAQIMGKNYQPDNGFVRLPMNSLAKGVYLMNIKTENSLLNYKILKR